MARRGVVAAPIVRAALAVSCCGVAAALVWAGRARPAQGTTSEDVQRTADAIGNFLRERGAALQSRAQTLADLPRLAAAVSTDEQTVHDLTGDELSFRPQPGETIVLAQRAATGITPLLRLPAASTVVVPLDRTGVGIAATTSGLVLSDTISIVPTQEAGSLTGSLGVAWTIDRAAVASHVATPLAGATLVVSGHVLALDGAPTAAGASASTTAIDLAGFGAPVQLVAATGRPAVPARTPLRALAGLLAAAGLGAALGLGRRRRDTRADGATLAGGSAATDATPSPAIADMGITQDTAITLGVSSRLLPRAASGLVAPSATAVVAPMHALTTLGLAPAAAGSGTASPAMRRHTFAAGSAHVVAHPMTTVSSSRFGRYEPTIVLGTGSTATVYLARAIGEAGFEKRVALKLLHPQIASNPGLVDSFLDEARTASHLTHPNIVQILDLGRSGSDYFIAMEYIDGADLETLLQHIRDEKRQVPIAIALAILQRICDGLDAAHLAVDETGGLLEIVHRDIKPANIMISRNGEVKVADFGIAKVARSLHHSELGMTKGTPAFMAPEQRRGELVDSRADVYSVAAIGYELLTGSEIDLDFERLLELGRTGWPHLEPMVSMRPAVPAELDAILLRALAFDPKYRPNSCDELEEAISAIARTHGYHASDKDIARWIASELPSQQSPTMRGWPSTGAAPFRADTESSGSIEASRPIAVPTHSAAATAAEFTPPRGASPPQGMPPLPRPPRN